MYVCVCVIKIEALTVMGDHHVNKSPSFLPFHQLHENFNTRAAALPIKLSDWNTPMYIIYYYTLVYYMCLDAGTLAVIQFSAEGCLKNVRKIALNSVIPVTNFIYIHS